MRNDYLDNNKNIQIGFIGGGRESSIGLTHRIASRIDRRYSICAGVFSNNKFRSKQIAKKLGIDEDRAYSNYQEMAYKENMRNDANSVVSIVTPPSSHYKIAKCFLNLGYNIICDKPLVQTIEQGIKLKKLAKKNNLPFCITYNYTGYPLVREAKALVKSGKIGKIINVNIEYLQGHIIGLNENNIKKTLNWRSRNSCGSLVLSEIGTHAFHMAEFVSGIKIKSVYANIKSNIVKKVDDNANVLLKFSQGAQGLIWVSFSSVGGESGLKFRINGTKGSIEWLQDNPNEMKLNICQPQKQ